MALNIARLLNCAQSDRDELNALLDEYMVADDSDTDSTSDDDFGHDSSDDEQDFDFRDNDFDTAMATADSLDSTEIVMDVAEDELKKSTAFRYVRMHRACRCIRIYSNRFYSNQLCGHSSCLFTYQSVYNNTSLGLGQV